MLFCKYKDCAYFINTFANTIKALKIAIALESITIIIALGTNIIIANYSINFTLTANMLNNAIAINCKFKLTLYVINTAKRISINVVPLSFETNSLLTTPCINIIYTIT